MKSSTRFMIFYFAISIALFSCNKSENDSAMKDYPSYPHGVYVSNEGAYGNNNGSVSYYDTIANKTELNILDLVNGMEKQDVVQSFFITNNKGFILVNNAASLLVVNMNDFKVTNTISVHYPRYMTVVNNLAYITNGIDNGVYIADLATNRVVDTLKTGAQPEHILASGSFIYVANGAWGLDSTISIIDCGINKVVNTITTGDGAVNLAKDKNGDIWVLCEGKTVYSSDWTQIIGETDSKLVKLHNNTVVSSFVIGAIGDGFSPTVMTADEKGENIYVAEKAGVYKVSMDATSFPSQPVIPVSANGLAVNSANGDIYLCESLGYATNGKLHVYSKNFHEKATQITGIAPNGVVLY
jgi:YVTN family beta-propeller protein